MSPPKYILWYSLEAPYQGASNEYPQDIFLWRRKKNIYLDTFLSGTMEDFKRHYVVGLVTMSNYHGSHYHGSHYHDASLHPYCVVGHPVMFVC